jgi:hypothetical protein
MFWEPNLKSRERNEAIEKPVFVCTRPEAIRGAAGYCAGVEGGSLAQGVGKGQKDCSKTGGGHPVRLEIQPLHR